MRGKGILREIKESDLEQLFIWRNLKHIRNNMYNDKEIKLEEHLAWFRGLSFLSKQQAFVYEYEGALVGYVSFSNMDYRNHHCWWGFYIGNNLGMKGMGTFMGKAALNAAFYDYDFHKVYGEILSFNEKSIRYHERLGFTKEGALTEHIYRNQTYYDVIVYGLKKEEWEKKRGEL